MVGMNRTEVITQLSEDWQRSGLMQGDIVLIHSSIARILRKIKKMGLAPDANIILESFIEAVGTSGTLIFPLFNFDFTTGVPFDIKHTKSHMGALSEAARLWPGAVRTGHPIYSFAVVGKEANRFKNLKNVSGYGPDSPFAMLHKMRGKIGVIDLPDQNSMTFYHYIEELLNVDYRYHKNFTSQYIDELGKESTSTFSLFVRNIEEGVLTKVDPMGEILWSKGLYLGFRPKQETGLRVIESEDIFNEVSNIINSGCAEGVLYEKK